VPAESVCALAGGTGQDHLAGQHAWFGRSVCMPALPAHVVMLQDIPKSAERAPSRCFYTFKADIGSICARLTSE